MSDKVPNCNNLYSFQVCVKKALEQFHELTEDGSQNMDQAQKQATTYIVEVINDLQYDTSPAAEV